MIIYVGDIHGQAKYVEKIDKIAAEIGIEFVVQVGDFGIRWGGQSCPIHKYFMKRDRKNRPGPIWYTCGGNHDNWDKWGQLAEKQSDSGDLKTVELAPGCFYVVRGTTIDLAGKKHLFFGGAESIDKHTRSEGSTWWASETPSAEEFQKFFDAMDNDKPDVVVTHDAPLCVPIIRPGRDTSPTPRNLQNVLNYCDHTPEFWYFGHHHVVESWEIDGIKFWCCGLHGEFVNDPMGFVLPPDPHV